MKRSELMMAIFIPLGVGLFILISVILWAIDRANQNSAAARPPSDAEVISDAWFECKVAALDRLKNPGGADFPWKSEIRASRQPNGTITIRAYVDATNGFGAVVRTPFVCEAKKVGATYIATVKFLE